MIDADGARARIFRTGGLLFLALLWGAHAGAIHPLDQLHYGQDLVDRATVQIDRETGRLMKVAGDRAALYRGVRALSAWEASFAADTIGERYYLEGPEGLLIRDGVADTLVVRLTPVLAAYVKKHPDEILDPARQAFELATARVPVPPGRFLGFHFVDLSFLLGAQADTILTVLAHRQPPADPAGVQDGLLRRLWDLGQLYTQTHSSASEKYFSTVVQEDWICRRLRSQKCGQRGFRYTKEFTGMKDDPCQRCSDLLYGAKRESATPLDRIECRHWGHVFHAVSDSCPEDTVRFSVPLPYYRELQIRRALGKEELPDLRQYFHPRADAPGSGSTPPEKDPGPK